MLRKMSAHSPLLAFGPFILDSQTPFLDSKKDDNKLFCFIVVVNQVETFIFYSVGIKPVTINSLLAKYMLAEE